MAFISTVFLGLGPMDLSNGVANSLPKSFIRVNPDKWGMNCVQRLWGELLLTGLYMCIFKFLCNHHVII
jgi:hypothetical protein